MSETVKHTHSGWQIVSVGDDNPKYAIADADRVSILTLAYEDGVAFAAVYDENHAHLIAAAPEMLEALKLVMEEKAPRYHDCTDDGLPKCAWCFAEEAIAKAEGENPNG